LLPGPACPAVGSSDAQQPPLAASPWQPGHGCPWLGGCPGCRGGRGHAGALWRVAVLLLLLSASHPLSSPFSPPSSLPLAGPRRLRLGTQPGTVPPSSGALCLRRRPPAVLCLPLGWRLRPRRVLERKAFPIPPRSVGCCVARGAGGCLTPAGPCRGAGRPRRVLSVEGAQLGRAGVLSRVQRGRAPSVGRTYVLCRSSLGLWCWQSSQRLGTVSPSPGALAARPRGQCPSRLCVSPAPCWTCQSAGHHGGRGTGSAHRVWHGGALPRLASPRRVLGCLRGRGSPFSPSPPVSRPRQGQADDAPAAPFGPVPAAAQVWLWRSPCSRVAGTSPLCRPCQRSISHTAVLRRHCAVSCVPP